jgi:hypothetical protein
MELLRCPHIAVAGERNAHSVDGLPCLDDRTRRRLVEVCPEEGRLVFGDLRRSQEVLGDSLDVEVVLSRVLVGGNEMDVKDLSWSSVSRCTAMRPRMHPAAEDYLPGQPRCPHRGRALAGPWCKMGRLCRQLAAGMNRYVK